MSSVEWETAIASDDLETVKRLAMEDPDCLVRPVASGVTPLLHALYNRAMDTGEWLASRQVSLNAFEAAALGDDGQLERLLDAEPALVGARAVDGFSPLHLAAFFGHAGSVGLLISRGADVNAVADNATRVSPLHSAAASRDTATVRAVLAGRPDPDARQAGGFTALHSAAMHGNESMVESLLEAGADPSVKADDGRDAAAFAREGGFEALAKQLED